MNNSFCFARFACLILLNEVEFYGKSLKERETPRYEMRGQAGTEEILVSHRTDRLDHFAHCDVVFPGLLPNGRI